MGLLRNNSPNTQRITGSCCMRSQRTQLQLQSEKKAVENVSNEQHRVERVRNILSEVNAEQQRFRRHSMNLLHVYCSLVAFALIQYAHIDACALAFISDA